MKTYAISKALYGSVFVIAACVSTAASADNYSETYVGYKASDLRTATVSYADLDLSKAAGREALERRISHAARNVCGSANYRQAGSLRRATPNRACYQRALSSALSQTTARQIASVAK